VVLWVLLPEVLQRMPPLQVVLPRQGVQELEA